MGTLDREDEPAPILLESGDIVILSGTSRRAFHGVPRILERTCPDYLTQSESSPAFKPYAEFIQSARININIRQVFE